MSEWELDKLLREINGEIAQLQSCLGRETEAEKQPPSAGLRLALVKNKAAGGRAPAKVSNAQAAGIHSRDVQEVCGVVSYG